MAWNAESVSYKTLEDAIGHTPLVRLQRLPGEWGTARGNVVLGKLEGNNPAGSVKDRPAISMIKRAAFCAIFDHRKLIAARPAHTR